MLRRFLALTLAAHLTLAAVPAAELPVRKVVLYKHGIGFFERAGRVAAGEAARFDFKASEMNDVLKSLTLIDRAGGKVEGVSYEASDPITKQLENFGFNVPADASLSQVLDQFKGARLMMRAPSGEIHGSILSARRTVRATADRGTSEVELVTLLLDSGEMKVVPLAEATELRLEDPRLQKDLANYLSIVANGRRRDLRALRIHPGNAKDLAVGYVVEAPVWKTSYRLVTYLRKPGEALLQGWAIVDNPGNEDWKGVELSLISGLPISFTQNLYAPHYMRRPNVDLPYEMAVGPKVFEGAMLKDERAAAGAGTAGSVGGRFDAQRQMAKSMALAEARPMNAAAPPPPRQMADMLEESVRSEERRVGKECRL